MSQMFDSQLLAALLEWQAELGADEAIGDAPVDRYALAAAAPKPAASAPAPAPAAPAADPVVDSRRLAAGAPDLAALAEAQAGYEHCELKRGARNFVFADGRAGARVMVLGEAPGRDEDLQGKPFVGRAGQLLDLMFAAIGLSRASPDMERALYISNIMPWRPPGNREPEAAEMAMMMPFVERHVALADPEVLVLMGNTPCAAVLGKRGITRLRGQWTQAFGKPVLPMLHPAYLLRNPAAKRQAWADLLTLQTRLRET
ncbi:uracil-DNA glycosylase [Ruixingdingia sedimenti]|uniref:Type-4 uracil-DNA glycosylase n=1 Tax=Ruixingdingia sedimenti TaxID=3073604 RepID=A0ABU1F920_9RHOB|nr:uracil-DNA glycosylase [Xinfangfangia sp. LG-4]MDR5653375.1 uracil-DNA glycosylase [Xinfangfangia sp. LG-4]